MKINYNLKKTITEFEKSFRQSVTSSKTFYNFIFAYDNIRNSQSSGHKQTATKASQELKSKETEALEQITPDLFTVFFEILFKSSNTDLSSLLEKVNKFYTNDPEKRDNFIHLTADMIKFINNKMLSGVRKLNYNLISQQIEIIYKELSKINPANVSKTLLEATLGNLEDLAAKASVNNLLKELNKVKGKSEKYELTSSRITIKKFHRALPKVGPSKLNKALSGKNLIIRELAKIPNFTDKICSSLIEEIGYKVKGKHYYAFIKALMNRAVNESQKETIKEYALESLGRGSQKEQEGKFRNLLIYAAKSGNKDLLDKAFDRKARLKLPSTATSQQITTEISWLKKEFFTAKSIQRANGKLAEGFTLLHYACIGGHAEMIKDIAETMMHNLSSDFTDKGNPFETPSRKRFTGAINNNLKPKHLISLKTAAELDIIYGKDPNKKGSFSSMARFYSATKKSHRQGWAYYVDQLIRNNKASVVGSTFSKALSSEPIILAIEAIEKHKYSSMVNMLASEGAINGIGFGAITIGAFAAGRLSEQWNRFFKNEGNSSKLNYLNFPFSTPTQTEILKVNDIEQESFKLLNMPKEIDKVNSKKMKEKQKIIEECLIMQPDIGIDFKKILSFTSGKAPFMVSDRMIERLSRIIVFPKALTKSGNEIDLMDIVYRNLITRCDKEPEQFEKLIESYLARGINEARKAVTIMQEILDMRPENIEIIKRCALRFASLGLMKNFAQAAEKLEAKGVALSSLNGGRNSAPLSHYAAMSQDPSMILLVDSALKKERSTVISKFQNEQNNFKKNHKFYFLYPSYIKNIINHKRAITQTDVAGNTATNIITHKTANDLDLMSGVNPILDSQSLSRNKAKQTEKQLQNTKIKAACTLAGKIIIAGVSAHPIGAALSAIVAGGGIASVAGIIIFEPISAVLSVYAGMIMGHAAGSILTSKSKQQTLNANEKLQNINDQIAIKLKEIAKRDLIFSPGNFKFIRDDILKENPDLNNDMKIKLTTGMDHLLIKLEQEIAQATKGLEEAEKRIITNQKSFELAKAFLMLASNEKPFEIAKLDNIESYLKRLEDLGQKTIATPLTKATIINAQAADDMTIKRPPSTPPLPTRREKPRSL